MVRTRKGLSSETRTYTLVQFVEDDIFHITSLESITPIEGKLVWAPYKSMGYYEANLIATNSNKSALTKLLQEHKRRQASKGIEYNVTQDRIQHNRNESDNDEGAANLFSSEEASNVSSVIENNVTQDTIQHNRHEFKNVDGAKNLLDYEKASDGMKFLVVVVENNVTRGTIQKNRNEPDNVERAKNLVDSKVANPVSKMIETSVTQDIIQYNSNESNNVEGAKNPLDFGRSSPVKDLESNVTQYTIQHNKNESDNIERAKNVMDFEEASPVKAIGNNVTQDTIQHNRNESDNVEGATNLFSSEEASIVSIVIENNFTQDTIQHNRNESDNIEGATNLFSSEEASNVSNVIENNVTQDTIQHNKHEFNNVDGAKNLLDYEKASDGMEFLVVVVENNVTRETIQENRNEPDNVERAKNLVDSEVANPVSKVVEISVTQDITQYNSNESNNVEGAKNLLDFGGSSPVKVVENNVTQDNIQHNKNESDNIERAKNVDFEEASPVKVIENNVTRDTIQHNKNKSDNIESAKNVLDSEEASHVSEVIENVTQDTIEHDRNEFENVEMAANLPSSEVTRHVDELSQDIDKKSSHKRHCCFFCKKIMFQIVRHWNNVHSQEDEVKIIQGLHISNPLRREKINKLRRKGDFEYNKTRPSNGKDCIVTRMSNNKEAVFMPCPSCLGYFSKKNLRHHKQRCSPNKGSRYLQGSSRKLIHHIHVKASETLKEIITPDMFHDEVTNQVFFDEILVTYGNYLCIKYTEHHLKNHIRAQLRLLGRFMLQVKAYDHNIKNCKELINSRNIDTVRKAIDDIAKIDPSINIYEHPTNARSLLTELKKIIQVVKSESDKTEDDILMKRAKGFSRRVKQEVAPYINRVCKNSENRHRRLKQKKYNALPENNEIENYLKDLYKNISAAQKEFAVKFSLSAWTILTKNLMIYLGVFNRKRPGETQRIEIADFYNRECVSSSDLTHLDKSERIQANKYERIGFRGKLGNSTALLVDKIKVLPGLKLVLKYREAAGVHPSNRFLFAKPSKTEKNITFDAYRCHKELCEIMGVHHENLSFTKLRKHLATEVAKKGTSQEEEQRVSTYMSHDFNIHRKIYDQSTALIDITKVSKHLEGAMNEKKHKKINVKCKNKRKDISIETSSNDDDSEIKSPRKMQFSPRIKYKRRLVFENYTSNISGSIDEPSLEEVEDSFGTMNGKRTEKISIKSRNKRKDVSIGTSSDDDDSGIKSPRRMQCSPHIKYKRNFKKRRLGDQNYSPSNISDSSDDEPSLEDVENCLGKFRKRRLWTSLEKSTTRHFFEDEIFNNNMVEKEKLWRFKQMYKEVMMHRPIPMIKQWIEKEKLKINQRKNGFEGQRPRFSTPEKLLLETTFKRHSLEGSEPSIGEMEELISNHDILKRRSAESLLRKIKRIEGKKSMRF